MEYTADQKKILSIQTGKHIVHAPAGCGKTEMLTQRVIQALKYGENPSTMICLTFTNRAAIEMTQRLKASTHHTDSQLPFVGNIHKFCNLYLRKNKFLPDSSSLLDEDEYKTILNGIIKKNDKKTVVLRHDLFKYLSDQKRIDLGLSPIYKNYNESFEQHKHIYNAIYTHYEQVKKEFNFYDFDDLLNLTNYHLKNSTENKQEQQFSSFNWLQIDEVHIPTITQDYVVVGTDSTGCIGTDTVQVAVLPTSSSTQNETSIDSYVWSVNGQTYTQSGTYTDTLLNVLGCDSIVTLNLDLNFTGIPSENDNEFNVFPNPVNELLTIINSSNASKNIKLIDKQGRLVLESIISKETNTINLAHLESGNYLLFIEGNDSPIQIIKK